MLVKLILVLFLVMSVLFAWRAWRQLPSLAIFAAGLAALFGVLMFKQPVLAGVGLVIAAGIIVHLSRPRQ